MLTRTTELGIAVLVHLADDQLSRGPIPVRSLAASLQSSPSYTTKVVHLLNRARLTRTWRGVPSGVSLARDPRAICLLEVVEVCQGHFLADYDEPNGCTQGCAFHGAMAELKQVLRGVLTHWTIADLISDGRHQCSTNCLASIVATGHTHHLPQVPLLPAGGIR